ncbi:MAG TPA: aspartate/glutamate racemase family protein [Vicinamibacterales bacterium]|nr:aspartate/glutamate racemase family protein [Vicinamibacterales bacterium]
MRILVINPNSSASMTEHIRRELEAVKGPATELTVVNPTDGPPAIESAADEAHAIPPTLRLVQQAEQDGYDAVVIACFADPGLDAAREIASIPVVGIEESALHVAAMLGHRFTVLTARSERVPAKIDHVARLGLQSRLASIRALGMGVLEMEADAERASARILEVGRAAVEEDGAEVLVLGCAGLAGQTSELARLLHVAIVDPTPVALKVAELLVDLRLAHSKRALYATPANSANGATAIRMASVAGTVNTVN